MNFENLIHQTSASQDYHRLIELCGSYGLNQEQTNQIISDFKNGSFAQHDQSIDQSFQQSLKDLEQQNATSTDRLQNQQYSFKHQKKNKDMRRIVTSHHDSLDNQLQSKSQRGIEISEDILQKYMNERKIFQQNIYKKLQQENQQLKKQLNSKQTKIEMFMKIKLQDSEIIQGLKDTIKSLASQLQQKDQSYRLLAQKYEKFKYENQNRMSAQHRSSKADLSHQQSITSFDQRQRKSIPKQNALSEIDQNKQLVKKTSQKYIKQFSRTKNNNSQSSQQNRQNIMKNEQSKRAGIDINKYKGMIQKLRNSYEIR